METLLGFLELQRRLHRDILTALHDKEERDKCAAGTSAGQKKKPARYPRPLFCRRRVNIRGRSFFRKFARDEADKES